MTNIRFSRFAITLVAALLIFAGEHQAQAKQARKTAPEVAENKLESLGFSSERLERFHAIMQRKVDEKELPGIVTILARHGKVVEERAYGKKDIASGERFPNPRSSLTAIASSARCCAAVLSPRTK